MHPMSLPLAVLLQRKDPEQARRYYFDGAAVEGKTFAGLLSPKDASIESEWGLVTTVSDLRQVVSLLTPADRKARLTLVGHSLGATIVEEFAAWDRASDEALRLIEKSLEKETVDAAR